MKSLRTLALAMFIVVIAASLAIFCLTLEAQSETGPSWTVVFRFKPDLNNQAKEPAIRIYIQVDGSTEGEAAINAHKALSEKLTVQAADRLSFVEAQAKR